MKLSMVKLLKIHFYYHIYYSYHLIAHFLINILFQWCAIYIICIFILSMSNPSGQYLITVIMAIICASSDTDWLKYLCIQKGYQLSVCVSEPYLELHNGSYIGCNVLAFEGLIEKATIISIDLANMRLN